MGYIIFLHYNCLRQIKKSTFIVEYTGVDSVEHDTQAAPTGIIKLQLYKRGEKHFISLDI